MFFRSILTKIIFLAILVVAGLYFYGSWSNQNWLASLNGRTGVIIFFSLAILMTILQIANEISDLSSARKPEHWRHQDIPPAAQPIIAKLFTVAINIRLVSFILMAVLLVIIFLSLLLDQ